MPSPVAFTDYIAAFAQSPFAAWGARAPWELTREAAPVVQALVDQLPAGEYAVADGVAIHHTAWVEAGAVLKGPLVLGPRCRVAAGAYLRGGNWLAGDNTLGPGCELKSSFLFAGSRLAHFNFLGDSVVGADVNFEAGSIVCNHRNERADTQVHVRLPSGLHATGCDKFGALVGDGSRIGANAVLAPGSLLAPGAVVQRLALWDAEAE